MAIVENVESVKWLEKVKSQHEMIVEFDLKLTNSIELLARHPFYMSGLDISPQRKAKNHFRVAMALTLSVHVPIKLSLGDTMHKRKNRFLVKLKKNVCFFN